MPLISEIVKYLEKQKLGHRLYELNAINHVTDKFVLGRIINIRVKQKNICMENVLL